MDMFLPRNVDMGEHASLSSLQRQVTPRKTKGKKMGEETSEE